MRKLLCALVVSALSLLPATAARAADSVHPLTYHGGYVMSNFTIYPLYYGNWSTTDVTNQQAYLTSFGAYMSGSGASITQQPVMNQYGVTSVAVAGAARSGSTATPRSLPESDVQSIIQSAQTAGLLPAYRADRLFMLFPAHGFSVPITGGCGYHSHSSSIAIYAIVPQDCGPSAGSPAISLVIAHEVFEAAADPLGNGWDESVDGCTTTFTYRGIVIPGPTDNTLGGFACTTTGYTTKDEIQVYGWSYTDYRAQYDKLWNQGWRLYSLQSYVSPTNQVLYNAVWRPSGNIGEIQLYGWSLSAFQSQYNTLWSQGWRLYILQSYVVNGQVLYNAVWHPGDQPEIQVYGWAYNDYRAKYDSLWNQGWRLYILQSYVVNGQVLYNAVWRPGTHGEIQVYGWSYTDYRSEYDTLWNQGWRLYVLDTLYVNGQPSYNAVWRQNTIDRPL